MPSEGRKAISNAKCEVKIHYDIQHFSASIHAGTPARMLQEFYSQLVYMTVTRASSSFMSTTILHDFIGFALPEKSVSYS